MLQEAFVRNICIVLRHEGSLHGLLSGLKYCLIADGSHNYITEKFLSTTEGRKATKNTELVPKLCSIWQTLTICRKQLVKAWIVFCHLPA